jgi:hypothetical protein
MNVRERGKTRAIYAITIICALAIGLALYWYLGGYP